MGGGSIEGYFIDDYDAVIKKFGDLLDKERLTKKYGTADKFLFAVGDGNHSLATAKAHWDNVKQGLKEDELKTYPARYALVELVNVYDEGIYFEPIFRYVYGVDKERFIEGLSNIDGGKMRVYASNKMDAYNGANGLPDGIRAVDAFIKGYLEKFGGGVD